MTLAFSGRAAEPALRPFRLTPAGTLLVADSEPTAQPSHELGGLPPHFAVTPSIALEMVLPASWGAGSRRNDGRPDSLLFAPERGKGFTLSSVMLQGRSESTGLVVSVFLLAAPGPGGAAECRVAYFNAALASPFEKTDVVRSERGPIALGEYLIPRAEGMELQKHMNAYLVRDGVWMDVHLSRVGFQPRDQVLFGHVVSSIRFSDR